MSAEQLIQAVLDAHANYERMGEICPFEGHPMIYASVLEELAEIARTTDLTRAPAQQGGEVRGWEIDSNPPGYPGFPFATRNPEVLKSAQNGLHTIRPLVYGDAGAGQEMLHALKEARWRIVQKDTRTDDYQRLDKPVVEMIDRLLAAPVQPVGAVDRDAVKSLALAHGFKLKEQPDGTMDLNPYVYEFAAAMLAAAPTPPAAEPVFWVRFRSDGGYDGVMHDLELEEVRKRSGAWTPLYTHPPASPADSVDAGRYRWLRATDPIEWPISMSADSILAPDYFDAAIDQAMAQAGGGQ